LGRRSTNLFCNARGGFRRGRQVRRTAGPLLGVNPPPGILPTAVIWTTGFGRAWPVRDGRPDHAAASGGSACGTRRPAELPHQVSVARFNRTKGHLTTVRQSVPATLLTASDRPATLLGKAIAYRLVEEAHDGNGVLSRIAWLGQRFRGACPHPAEADIRAQERGASFDPNRTFSSMARKCRMGCATLQPA
jgi:hypothetical protein